MPRFSVIVPAYQVQAYLHECLTSVLEQSFADWELIAVEDRSPDGCAAIIDEFAARDTRVRAVHLEENVGLGRARNAGMEHATGDYLIFLDADDSMAPGSLQAIADRLKETGEPDVLVYDYERTYWTGERVRNQLAHLLHQDGPAPFELADRSGLLRLLMVAWNKAHRREFVERVGLTFPPGTYEDAPWTYPLMMSAKSIATLDRVCVRYRQRRRGGILGTASRAHFDVFDQYERVFAFLDTRRNLPDAWRALVFRRMVDHLLAIYARPERLPHDSRAEFLRRARAHYRRFHVPGSRPRAGARLQHALVRLGSHRAYQTLRSVRRFGARLARYGTGVLGRARESLLRLHYRIQLRRPVRADLAVFTAGDGRGHSGDPGALEAAFREHAPHVRTAWLAAPAHHHTLPTATQRLTPGTAAAWTALARAAYLVSDAGFDRRLVKRPGQLVVHTHRGTPLRHEGADLLERPAAVCGTDVDARLRSADTWDYVLSPNRHATLAGERAYPATYTTLEYGCPRNDRYQRATAADVARIRESLGVRPGTTAILYAPEYRDYRRTQRLGVDLERLLRRLGPRFTVLVHAPHVDAEPLPDDLTGRWVDVSGEPDAGRLCLAADALVTDYSSLMFDYANLDRPIVLHADDWEAYEAARGTYFDVRAFPPGAVARGEDELADIFASGHWRGSRSAQLRRAFRERFCPHDDGSAAERVVRRVVFGAKIPLPSVVALPERHPTPAAGPEGTRVSGAEDSGVAQTAALLSQRTPPNSRI
ncbi:bifunctional glycosyltransferase/CDP-glycerol:glycerophosphate glycerophosphotransferase [Streptomyces spectabilis]|uniref:CDP-glycerol:glycerophosphate glycerophosphotransferase n=1 Tax=Streptomyces spectabilis TaxID=68270 RepID=A0A5P2X7A9_STRST|nr:bifunctional glycosyltransferase family 2 protein/CDP-glycerol:glycerophosphate glycerophosphotransferase [Streptomyces spectabilis]MBB5106462.1 CRISPR system Cascade subunit CasB [Streptomyces spectabilis]MCI3903071.1 bifunctional glycosyltransferase family 2 protein/CDP-glycerol:glycerophosphate glycerophosphotransferase [Streptomyces spectabilis]QEV60321.1 CDP-glycerol:glycerophosphate glycerophosphotransferase [Streptomyces spectabilis]GGV32521.1 glycosyl transferase [Streptomyces specta